MALCRPLGHFWTLYPAPTWWPTSLWLNNFLPVLPAQTDAPEAATGNTATSTGLPSLPWPWALSITPELTLEAGEVMICPTNFSPHHMGLLST